jgi:hypothetical protein
MAPRANASGGRTSQAVTAATAKDKSSSAGRSFGPASGRALAASWAGGDTIAKIENRSGTPSASM